jgi:hypothetical protein
MAKRHERSTLCPSLCFGVWRVELQLLLSTRL